MIPEKRSHFGSRVSGLIYLCPSYGFFLMGMDILPRSSPAHLIYKLRRATEEVAVLANQIDKKVLSDSHRAKLRSTLTQLEQVLWPDQDASSQRVVLPDDKKAAQSSTEPEAIIKQKGEQQVEIAALEAKIEYLNRERTTREERGTLIHSTHIRHRESASHRSYANLFGRFFAGATSLTIREPYIEASHQLTNLSEFLEMAIQASGVFLQERFCIRKILHARNFNDS